VALDGLRELIDQPEAVWTSSLQRDAVMAVLNTEKDVLAILTTSSGKSMLALIPSLLEDNLITVLILPLKSLITDYKRKLDKMHLRYLHYTGKTVSRGYCTPNLVLVSVDLN
jgi:superfamily II DNA helicase RecQ